MSPRERFAELLGRLASTADLVEAALWIAAEERPGLDVRSSLAELDAHAERVRVACGGASGELERLAALQRVFFGELGFRGNTVDYYDPRNSDLAWVLQERRGIPITLCLLFMELGRRTGLEVEGVGFPGHFLARVRGPEEVLIDAFAGRTTSEEECASGLRARYGDRLRFHRALLRACTPEEILSRMLRNLKHAYLRAGDYARALACCDRLLLLEPDAPTELHDRGVLYLRLECPRAALADLERYVALAPDAEGVEAVRRTLATLRERSAHLH